MMNRFTNAGMMLACASLLLVVPAAAQTAVTTAHSATELWQDLDQLKPLVFGKPVKLTLSDGSRVNGTVVGTLDDKWMLHVGQSSCPSWKRGDVAHIPVRELDQVRYRRPAHRGLNRAVGWGAGLTYFVGLAPLAASPATARALLATAPVVGHAAGHVFSHLTREWETARVVQLPVPAPSTPDTTMVPRSPDLPLLVR